MSRTVKIALAAATLVVVGAVTSLALARTTSKPLKTARNATLHERILVNAHGMTMYELSPETSDHLLCTSKLCLQFWPPVTVRSAGTKVVRPSGLKGRIGILHRNGFRQLMINGRPLYLFKEDTAPGQVHGQNFPSFGGTWHVVATGTAASSGNGSATAPTTTTPTLSTTTTTTTTTPYSY
jgi:predicted lipoprotein with Yx(FWY)xxD motif